MNWNNTFGYKNFDLSLTMRGAFGFQIWNSAAAFHGVPAMFTAGWNVMEKAFDPVFGKRPLAVDQPLAYVSYHIENGDFRLYLEYKMELVEKYSFFWFCF